MSPASDIVAVLPGASVRFEVQADPGIEVEYVIDGRQSKPGPVLLFHPSKGQHVVSAVVRSTGPAATLLEKDFTVVVEVPGNIAPEVVILDVDTDLEAKRDTVHASTIVRDPDGSVQRIDIDFGDGTVESSVGKSTQFEVSHVYDTAGSYWVRATVMDSVQISSSDSTQIQILAPNQLPTGSLVVNGLTEGDAPLAVTLVPSGADSDGTVVRWEIDTGDGDFQEIQPFQPIDVAYEFSEDVYEPRLRLTDDDGDAAVIEADAEILVFRSIDVNGSTVEGVPNRALSASGRKFILADGRDPFTINVLIRDPQGALLADVPVRVSSLRPTLVAADGSTDLGSTILFQPGATVETGNDGRAVVSFTTTTSTRVEAVPDVASTPFDLRIEASRGHGEWVELAPITDVETETVAHARAGLVTISKLGGGGYCAGDTIEIRVKAIQRSGAPATGLYTDIRYSQFVNQVWFGARPGPGFAAWRTNGSGEIVFRYVPTKDDDDRLVAAWVDGNRLESLAAFNFKPGC